MAVRVAAGPDGHTLEIAAPVPLFRIQFATGSGVSPGTITGTSDSPQYAVAADGRFLMNVIDLTAPTPPITVVLNWPAGLKTVTPSK